MSENNVLLYLFVGTFANKEGDGIFVYKFDSETGNVTNVSNVFLPAPSHFALSSDETKVYAVSTTPENSNITALNFNKSTGAFSILNSKSVHGNTAVYSTISPNNKYVISSNYGTGSLSLYEIDTDGSLQDEVLFIQFIGTSSHPLRQSHSYVHSVVFSPDGKFALIPDLGTDRIYIYRTLDEKPYLYADHPNHIEFIEGTGPRHLRFHPNQKWVYLSVELAGRVYFLEFNDGNMNINQNISVDDQNGESTSDLQITPNGKFLYVSVRNPSNLIRIFSINSEDGHLEEKGNIQTGKTPRNLLISPNGKFLLSGAQDDDFVEIFEINQDNGNLTKMETKISLMSPGLLLFAVSP